jgi:hypothetical protein
VSALTDTRARLAYLLDGVLPDVQVFSELPERVTPPCIAVGPGDPYVEFEGATFGARRVRLAATFIGDVGTNDIRAGEIDEAVVAMVTAIDNSGEFMVTQVAQPGQIAINGQACLGVMVLALTEVEF